MNQKCIDFYYYKIECRKSNVFVAENHFDIHICACSDMEFKIKVERFFFFFFETKHVRGKLIKKI